MTILSGFDDFRAESVLEGKENKPGTQKNEARTNIHPTTDKLAPSVLVEREEIVFSIIPLTIGMIQHEIIRQQRIRHENRLQENIRQERIRHENRLQEIIRQERIRHENILQEIIRQERIRLQNILQEIIRLEQLLQKLEQLQKQELKEKLRLFVLMMTKDKLSLKNILEKKRGILQFQLWNEKAIALVLWICGDIEINPGPTLRKSEILRKFMRHMQTPLLLQFYKEKGIKLPPSRDLFKCEPPGWTGKYFVNISNKKNGGHPSEYEIFDDMVQVLEKAEIEMDPVLEDYRALRLKNSNESESKSRLQRLNDYIALNQIEKITNNNPNAFCSQLLQQEQMMKQGKLVASEEYILQIERLLQTAKSNAASKRKRELTDTTDSDHDENSPRHKATRMDDENNLRKKSTPCKDSSENTCQEQLVLQNAEDDASTLFDDGIGLPSPTPSEVIFVSEILNSIVQELPYCTE